VANPTEIALIRMQADSMKPPAQRQNYSSAFNALHRIAQQESIVALWKGSSPTIIRAMSTNFGQLAFFAESKHQIHKYSSLPAQQQTALAAFIAGFVGATISLPFDFVKTRLQNQSVGGPAKGISRYSGMVDCFAQVARKEGLFRFYRDFWPYFMRVAPHSQVPPGFDRNWI
jgi:solute carrier family 25 oxoglutarate transporter 11